MDKRIEMNFVNKNLSNNSVAKNPIIYLLYEYWVDESDPRVEGYWLFNGGPEMFALLMFSWLLFIAKLGPIFMKNRKPFVLREIMMAYNLILVIVNMYAICAAFKWLDFGRKVLQLKLPDKNDVSDETLTEINEKMIVFYSKLLDLMDTVFFVLRKKSNQISFLHVYHHFIVPLLAWMTYKLGIIQSCVFGVFVSLNSSIHVVMYSYYFLSALGPGIQKYLWWKRYITRFQLIQFAIFIIYAIYCFSFVDLSDYPDAIIYVVVFQPFLFFYLFMNFYLKTYKNKPKSTKTN